MRNKIYNDKRAMSAIVTTVIIVALALVAIGIVWAVINNILNESSGDVDFSQKCIDSIVSATSASCNSTGGCNVTLERTSGSIDIGGVKLIFSNSTTKGSAQTIEGNIAEFGVKSVTSVGVANATKVEVVTYFEDDAGLAKNCPGSTTYNF